MIGLTGDQIDSVFGKLMPQEEYEMEMYQVLKYHKDDIDNPEVVGCNLTRSQAAQLLHDTKVIQGKEMLISEPMPEEGYDE
tara:strand:+ start:1048 stop:1290 length:243 start_codon:yes stop_codon:yes gene_type:complete